MAVRRWMRQLLASGCVLMGTAALADDVAPGAIPDYVGVLGTYVDPADRRDADYRFGGTALAGYQLGQQIAAEVKAFGAGLKRESEGTHNILGVGGDIRATERHGFFLVGGGGLEYGSVDDSHRASPYIEAGAGFQRHLLSQVSMRVETTYRLLGNLGRNGGRDDGGFSGELWASAGLVFDWPGGRRSRIVGSSAATQVAVVPVRCPPAPEGLIVDPDGVLSPQDSRSLAIGFLTNSAVLDEAAKGLIAELAKALDCGVAQQLAIQVIGHADERSGDVFNVQLSRRRAIAVREALIAEGINPDRISVDAEGKYEPLEPGNNPEVNPLNRKIEIKLYPGIVPG